MLPVHIACRQPITYRVVLADDGEPVILRWCVACAVALNGADCDPSTAWSLDDVPADVLAQLLSTVSSDPRVS